MKLTMNRAQRAFDLFLFLTGLAAGIGLMIAAAASIAHAQEPAPMPTVQADAGLDFGIPKTFKLSDSQMYFRSFSGGSQTYLGTGAVFGPLLQLNYGTSWLADFIAVGGWPSVSLAGGGEQDPGTPSLIIGIEVFNFWGLQGGVGYNPIARSQIDPITNVTTNDRFTDRLLWGVGLSITDTLRQLSKAATPPPAP